MDRGRTDRLPFQLLVEAVGVASNRRSGAADCWGLASGDTTPAAVDGLMVAGGRLPSRDGSQRVRT